MIKNKLSLVGKQIHLVYVIGVLGARPTECIIVKWKENDFHSFPYVKLVINGEWSEHTKQFSKLGTSHREQLFTSKSENGKSRPTSLLSHGHPPKATVISAIREGIKRSMITL